MAKALMVVLVPDCQCWGGSGKETLQRFDGQGRGGKGQGVCNFCCKGSKDRARKKHSSYNQLKERPPGSTSWVLEGRVMCAFLLCFSSLFGGKARTSGNNNG